MKRVLLALMLLGLAQTAVAYDSFVIEDIRLEGLQRITPGTVFNYLPLEVGDRLTERSGSDAIRALFETGFFADVSLARQGNILVLEFAERPAISSIDITGNRDIKSEDLQRALRGIGLAEGEVFNRLELDKVEQELIRQYHSRGKYSVNVETSVDELARNRVDIDIVIAEGKPAKIKHINIVGNENYSDEEIIDGFESSTTNWLSWWKSDDQYSREKVSGDLEKLRSFYLDRGHVDVEVESTQVSISPDKRNIYLTANVQEGPVYDVSEVKLTGEFVLDRGVLERLLLVKPEQTFSRRRIEASIENIKSVLGNIGYAFAEVTPRNEVNRDDQTVAVTLLVEPGQRVYVRRVEFFGNEGTDDEVLRREMRQFEGAWFSQAAVDRSRVRLQRLGFFEDVQVETPRVPGSDDQVDVKVTVKERNSGAFQFAVGYSQSRGAVVSASLSQRNFLGTGKQVSLALNTSSAFDTAEVRYINPYYTDDGVSRGFSLRYRKVDSAALNRADYSDSTIGFGVNFGFPVSEVDRIRVGLNFDRREFETTDNTPQPIIDQITNFGGDYDIFGLELAWTHDSRNRYFNPTRGSLQELTVDVGLPGSEPESYRVRFHSQNLFPVADWLTVSAETILGYGDSYGDSSEGLPFFQRFYAGGVDSVRGFEDYSLSPRDVSDLNEDGEITEDEIGRVVGGDFLTVGRLEFVLPTPFVKTQANTRLALFTDVGAAFDNYDSFETDELRGSYGISLLWQAPVGPIQISYGVPVNEQLGDRTESLQFTFGSAF